MPKPFDDGFGSGAHMNMSLAGLDTGENAFEADGAAAADPRHGYGDLAFQFTAGVLRHAGAIAAVACPTVNSYKRLLPRGLMHEISWAPVFRAYGHNNRTLMCRLPMNRRCLELRIADSACNYYLASALTLAAGLEGVREALDPGKPVNVDTYSLSEDELAAGGVKRLPRTLGESIAEFELDELAAEVFGHDFHATYVRVKREEWDTYNTVVSEWERSHYLHLW
jgi:glutamine synthetase